MICWALTAAGWAAEQVAPRDIVRVVCSRMAAGLRSPTPLFPTDTALCHCLTLIDGVEYIAYKTMAATIGEQRGNLQEPVNWSNPDEWIAQQLEGTPQALARRLWHDSQRTLNPCYICGCWYLAAKHELFLRDRGDIQLRPQHLPKRQGQPAQVRSLEWTQ